MKFGKVLTYKDIEEAKRLIGKKVVGSNSLFGIQENTQHCICDTLANISDEDDAYIFYLGNEFFQFIREVIEEEPQYKPYDLSNEETRRKLLGRKYKDDYDCLRVVSFVGTTDINNLSVKNFLEECQWLEPYDGSTVCGERVE